MIKSNDTEEEIKRLNDDKQKFVDTLYSIRVEKQKQAEEIEEKDRKLSSL